MYLSNFSPLFSSCFPGSNLQVCVSILCSEKNNMTIAIGKKSKGQNDIFIVTSKTKLSGAVQIFVQQTLKFKKDDQFCI